MEVNGKLRQQWPIEAGTGKNEEQNWVKGGQSWVRRSKS